MIAIESDCVGCPAEMGCIYEACPNYKVVRYYCDRCQDETTLYHWSNDQLCLECILKELEEVEYNE